VAQPGWLRDTGFARSLRTFESKPTLSCGALAHALRTRWLLPGAVAPLPGDPYDANQRWTTLICVLLVTLAAVVLRSDE
jgi:hypothetical protein